MKKVTQTHLGFIDVTPFPDANGATRATSETLDPVSAAAPNFGEAKQM